MKELKITLVLVFLSCVAFGQSIERQVIASAGQAVQNSSGGLSYTTGEAVTQSYVSPAVALTQGFQQVSDDEFMSVLEPVKTAVELKVYPNPTTEMITISSNLFLEGIHELQYRIYDVHGKVVQEGTVSAGQDEIDVSSLAASSYTLLLESDDELFTYRSRFIKM